ncbi:MAG: MerR family transcriptional regulator [Rubricoccaceae bacterium]|nr:MerR family transcriptional regulator [Rubricoccaceae bacterium]
MKQDGIKKLYYSISEVSEMTELKPHVLRYWETEFSMLRPKKNRAGNRTYTASDIQLLETIKGLLRDDKYTLEGARQVLSQRIQTGKAKTRGDLRNIRAFLSDLLQQLPQDS